MVAWRRLTLTSLFLYWMFCYCIHGQSFELRNESARNYFTTIPTFTISSEITKAETVSYQTRQQEIRERIKQERLVLIQVQILKRLGLQRQPNISSSKLSEEEKTKLIDFFNRSMTKRTNDPLPPDASDEYYAKRFQTFYPSCSVPKNSSKNEWEKRSFFRLYFDLILPHGSWSTVTNAKLRLFKYGNNSSPTTAVPVTTLKPKYKKTKKGLKEFSNLGNFHSQEKLLVTIYQYIKAIKTNKKLKKKLIASQMINDDDKGWVEFDVRGPVKDWLQDSNKNLGLEIRVENSGGETENARNIFKSMNCSDHEVPFPTFVIEEASGLDENVSGIIDNETYPTLDLMTIDLPQNHPFQRPKRQAVCSTTKKKKRDCCLESLYISFKELGWHKWIIAPAGFYTNYCVGTCLSYKKLIYKSPIKNSVLQNSLLRRRKSISYSKNADCIPETFLPLHVAYIDENEDIRAARLEDIIISRCGCAI